MSLVASLSTQGFPLWVRLVEKPFWCLSLVTICLALTTSVPRTTRKRCRTVSLLLFVSFTFKRTRCETRLWRILIKNKNHSGGASPIWSRAMSHLNVTTSTLCLGRSRFYKDRWIVWPMRHRQLLTTWLKRGISGSTSSVLWESKSQGSQSSRKNRCAW